jgi:hypothetical protein
MDTTLSTAHHIEISAVLSVCYVEFLRALQLVILLFQSTEFKELKIVVLRYERPLLRRQVRRIAWLNSGTSRVVRQSQAAGQHERRVSRRVVSWGAVSLPGQPFPLLFSDSLTKIGCRQRPHPRCRREKAEQGTETKVMLTPRRA